MSRYIDADALEANLQKAIEVGKTAGLSVSDLETVLYAVRQAPSIDIVRCKECKYWVSDGGALMICDIHKDPTVPDHFCSYGEKESE